MSVRDPKRTSDGFKGLPDGVNSGDEPSILPPTQAAFAVNTMFRGGYAKCRPGISKRALTFPDEDGIEDTTLKTNFQTKRFQGAKVYEPITGAPNYIIASIGGRIFKIKLERNYAVMDITPPDGPNPNNRPTSWMEQAEEFMVIQDGQSGAIIFDGAASRRSNRELREVPTGTVMAYGWGRLWVATSDRHFFVAGDIVTGDSGTAAYDYRDAVLKFTENEFLNGGGSFGVPQASGQITAMKFPVALDNSTGQGPLQVFTAQGGWSVNAPVDRTIWQDLQYPIQSVNLAAPGPVSQNCVCPVNNDLWYRSFDGERSFKNAQRVSETQWENTPMSYEMNDLLDNDDANLLLDFSSAALFHNWLVQTISPKPTTQGVTHRGLVVLDFAPLGSIRSKNMAPVWNGLWTGLNILQVVQCANRCFLFVLSSTNKIELWELTKDQKFDKPDLITDNRIAWSLTPKSFGFKDQGQEIKRLNTADLWVDQVTGEVDFDVDYRPDQYPAFRDWANWSICSDYKQCGPTDCLLVEDFKEQYRPRMKLPTPAEACEAGANKSFLMGYEFQPRINVTGHCRLKLFRMHAHEEQEDPVGPCLTTEACSTLSPCEPNPFGYSSE